MEKAQILWLIALGALIIFVIITAPTLQQERQLKVGPPPDGGEGEGEHVFIEPEETDPSSGSVVIDPKFYCEGMGLLKQHAPWLTDVLVPEVWAQTDPPYCHPGGVAPEPRPYGLPVRILPRQHTPPSMNPRDIAAIICQGRRANGVPEPLPGLPPGGNRFATGYITITRDPYENPRLHSILGMSDDDKFYFTSGFVRYPGESGPPEHLVDPVYPVAPDPQPEVRIEMHTWQLSDEQKNRIREDHPDIAEEAIASLERVSEVARTHEIVHYAIFGEHQDGYFELVNMPPVPNESYDTISEALNILRNQFRAHYSTLRSSERAENRAFDNCHHELQQKAGDENVLGAPCSLETAERLEDECGYGD